jgi:hypothetical protein
MSLRLNLQLRVPFFHQELFGVYPIGAHIILEQQAELKTLDSTKQRDDHIAYQDSSRELPYFQFAM